MAMPRRHRLVAKTLDAVRDSFDPAEGLEAAARALAEEVLWREPQEQQESCSKLAQPRQVQRQPEDPGSDGPVRTWAQQQERCAELSQPREYADDPSQQDARPPSAPTPCAAEQQRRCAALAQPRRAAERLDMQGEDVPILSAPWRDQLISRANALVPEDVADARALLAQMCQRSAACKAEASSDALPAAKRASPEQEAALAELRGMVEEVLWAVLLTVRSCPKKVATSKAGAPASEAGSGLELEDRLSSILIKTVGPPLRPVARRVLAPAASLARRLRTEFPRLAVHLGLRDSEEMEPVASSWDVSEIQAKVESIRACRDQLLGMDLTKTLMSCFAG